ncbi:MAG: hypothetical protein K6F32_05750 [Bacilli bacterium]|nr:hypothetical protein [Bacilli bacterium]
MSKWLVTLNNDKSEYDSFEDALAVFLKEVSEYFRKHSYVNKESTEIDVFDSTNLPDSLGAFFNYLYNDRIITDNEILLETRLRMLLSRLACDNPVQIKDNALKSISKSYDYHYSDEEIGYLIDIKVDYSPEEIVVELNAYNGDSYLYTNAFVMDDSSKKYFLKSHQVCFTSAKKSDLGAFADLDITLEKNNNERRAPYSSSQF